MKKKDWSLGFALFIMVTMLIAYFMIMGTDIPRKGNLLLSAGNFTPTMVISIFVYILAGAAVFYALTAITIFLSSI